MPDWLGVLLVFYGFVTISYVIYCAVDLSMEVNLGNRNDRKRAARLLLAPFWPFYGVYRLIQIARTGE